MRKDKNKKEKKLFNKLKFKKGVSKFREDFIYTLNLPKELSGNYSKITMIENNELFIEGETSVVDYYDEYIKLKCNNVFIQIDGKKLKIEEFSNTELLVSGDILNIGFQNR